MRRHRTLGAAWLVAVATLALALSCGGKNARKVASLDGVKEGTRVRIEGTLGGRGSTPATTLALDMENGAVAALEVEDDAMRHELHGLDGMRCAVEGDVLPRLDADMPRLDVDRYELLPLATGEVPLIGFLTVERGACVLTTKSGERYWIVGDLALALRDYVGARVWVVGREVKTDATDRPDASTPFTPTGYGVIDEAPAR